MANVVNPTVAPAPQFPERGPEVGSHGIERVLGPDVPMQRGPLRVEEGGATDTDGPNDFAIGAQVDVSSAPVVQTTTTRRCSTSPPSRRWQNVPTSALPHGLRLRRSLESSFRASWPEMECPSLSVPSTLAHT